MARPLLMVSAVSSTLLALLVGETSCASRLRTPNYGPHTSLDIPLEVASPAPESVQVEEVEPSPEPRAVWVDGFWTYRQRRWVWEPGSWQIPPAQGYYARPSLIRIPVAVYAETDAGAAQELRGYALRLMFIPGHWHVPGGAISRGALVTTATPAASK